VQPEAPKVIQAAFVDTHDVVEDLFPAELTAVKRADGGQDALS